jgi:hypothetical protein
MMLAGCDSGSSTSTGTMDETNHAATAVVYSREGMPVAQAIVQAFRRDDTTRTASATILTGQDGSYALPTLENGLYRVIARKGSLVAVQDSVVAAGGKTTASSDTLEVAPTAEGTVKMVGDDNPASVLVQVQGTDVLANVDKNGKFSLGTLAAGTYTLRLSTTLDGYTVTARTVRIERDKVSKLDTIELNFTGVPPVTGFKASIDTMSGGVTLRWDLPDLKGVRDVLIRRVLKSSYDSAQVIGNSDSGTFKDRESVYFPTRQTWLYTAQIRMLDGRLGRVAYVTVNQPGDLGPTLSFGLVNRQGQFDSSVGMACKVGDTLRFRAIAHSGASPIAGVRAFLSVPARLDTLLRTDSAWILQWTWRVDSIRNGWVPSRAVAWDKSGRLSDSVHAWVNFINTDTTVHGTDSVRVPSDSVRPPIDTAWPVDSVWLPDTSKIVTDSVKDAVLDTIIGWTLGQVDTAGASFRPGVLDTVWRDSNVVTVLHPAGCGIPVARLDTSATPAVLAWTMTGGTSGCVASNRRVRTWILLGDWGNRPLVFWNAAGYRKVL